MRSQGWLSKQLLSMPQCLLPQHFNSLGTSWTPSWRFVAGCSAVRLLSSQATDDTLNRLERELDESIKSQKERLSRMDKLFSQQAQATPWRLVAVGTSAVALLCSWRLLRDKNEYERNMKTLQEAVNTQQETINRLQSGPEAYNEQKVKRKWW